MSRINTRLTRLLDIRTPIVSAPMAGASGGALASQVTAGGGFGFLAAGYDSVEKFRTELSLVRSLLQLEGSSQLPIGVGYLGWQLEKKDSPAIALLQFALENRVKAVWFSFGNELGRWVQYVRSYDQKNRNEENKTIIFIQVSSVEEALVAVTDWKVDVIVAQGVESGGHGHSSAPPLLTLVPSIISVLPDDGPPVLGAGGLASGSHVVSMLALRAAGAVLGTRFLLTPESLYTDAQRNALIAAKAGSTVRTMAFDYARGTTGWPSRVDGRALRNSTVEDIDRGVNIEEVRRKYKEGVECGDVDRMVIWAGTSVGLMTAVEPAQEVVQKLHQEATQSLRDVGGLINIDDR